MKYLFTLLALVVIQSTIFSQQPITSSDIIPTVGDSWFLMYSFGGNEAFDVNLGDNGANALFDFSEYGATEDLFSGMTITDVNESNAAVAVEVVDGQDLLNVPDLFSNADFYFDYKETAGANWFMPFSVEDDGLHILGEMAITGASTPPEWTYHYGVHFGPGRNIPFDMVLGDTVVMERFVLENTPDGQDSVHIVDTYIFDAEGQYISPQGESYSDVCRLQHVSDIEIFVKQNGIWNYTDGVYQSFLEYRKRGYQMPLAEIAIDLYEPFINTVVSSWEIGADFYTPNFVLSGVEKKIGSLDAKVSPVPAHDFINISFPEELKVTNVTWLDQLGRVVDFFEVDDFSIKQLTLDTPNSHGIHFLHMNTSEGYLVKKIFIDKRS